MSHAVFQVLFLFVFDISDLRPFLHVQFRHGASSKVWSLFMIHEPGGTLEYGSRKTDQGSNDFGGAGTRCTDQLFHKFKSLI